MKTKSLLQLCRTYAEEREVDPDLAIAICGQESNFNPSAVRFEPGWKYFFEVEQHAKRLGITLETEKQLQAFSWGVMQVMGSVARELGFSASLPELIIPQNGLYYGIKKLKQLSEKYQKLEDIIAAYNGGNASKVNGRYKNAGYVESVSKRLSILKAMQ